VSNPGQAAEVEALALIREYFPDARASSGSGGVFQDGDLLGLPVHVEVKDQTRSTGFTVRKAEWEKTRHQALAWDKLPVLVVRNREHKLVAVCDLDLLLLALSHVPSGTL
jgi:hypothetical protein